MNIYKKTFELTIQVDLDQLDSDLLASHQDSWLSNKDMPNSDTHYITPTNKEMTDSLKSEVKSWLEALSLEVEIKESDHRLDFIVERLLKITSSGGTTCSYAKSEILEIVHTLENDHNYEVPNMAHLEED